MEWLVQFLTKYWLQVLFTVICGIFTKVCNNLVNKTKEKEVESIAIKESLLSLLDDRMGQMFDFCKTKGYVTSEQLRRYERMYEAYKNLGGNGAVKIQHEQFTKIPIQNRE